MNAPMTTIMSINVISLKALYKKYGFICFMGLNLLDVENHWRTGILLLNYTIILFKYLIWFLIFFLYAIFYAWGAHAKKVVVTLNNILVWNSFRKFYRINLNTFTTRFIISFKSWFAISCWKNKNRRINFLLKIHELVLLGYVQLKMFNNINCVVKTYYSWFCEM